MTWRQRCSRCHFCLIRSHAHLATSLGTEQLATAKSLTMLNLRGNTIHMVALLDLSPALQRMTALWQLWLWENLSTSCLTRLCGRCWKGLCHLSALLSLACSVVMGA